MTAVSDKSAPCATQDASTTADRARNALLDELDTWPKPGLVSPRDSGSHADMDAGTLARSATALRPFFGRLALAGERSSSLTELRTIGISAERAMMAATGGVNAHRGAIFAIGLLCAAAGLRRYRPVSAERAALEVAGLWGREIMTDNAASSSHGAIAARRYGVGGARREAADGFPTVRDVTLPAMRWARRRCHGDAEAARVHALFATLAMLDDTNLLHRGGIGGLSWAQRTAADFIAAGGVTAGNWRSEAERIHAAFVSRNLSPGGSADMLAIALFLENGPIEPGA